MKQRRMVLYISDVQKITGKCLRSSRTIYKNIQDHYNKLPKAFITIEEFCKYMGFKADDVERYIV